MPPPPPSLHNLSVEELMCFEGETRQAIENRLIILKNIQVGKIFSFQVSLRDHFNINVLHVSHVSSTYSPAIIRSTIYIGCS